MDLSRQLCEIAGIEASKKKCNDCADGACNGQISNEYIKQECLIYPNFETPENFVKLLELPIEKIENGGVRTLGYFVRKQTRKDFIKGVIESIERNYYANDIKQALQAQDWRY